jgi:hypothetical protein
MIRVSRSKGKKKVFKKDVKTRDSKTTTTANTTAKTTANTTVNTTVNTTAISICSSGRETWIQEQTGVYIITDLESGTITRSYELNLPKGF